DVMLDVTPSRGHHRALARFGDLHRLRARSRLEVAGELRRLVSDPRLLDGVAGLGLEVLVAVFADLAQRFPDGGVAAFEIPDVAYRVAEPEPDGDEPGEDRDAAPKSSLAGREPVPLAGEIGDRP